MRHILFRLVFLLPLLALASCETGNDSPAMQARRAAIAAEAPGDHYIGRRFVIERTHLWGYLRRPQQSWDTSRLVIMSERMKNTPDRLPESALGNGGYGYDHNHEYRIWGYFTGRKIFDPNSNLILPEFMLQNYELINPKPGFLFSPKDKFNGYQLLRSEPEALP